MGKHRKETKTGRNAPCPCGSGLKYKKCPCRTFAPLSGDMKQKIEEMFRRNEAKEMLRQHQQGRGKPIISAELQGNRFVAVGSELFISQGNKTFIDFLGDYIKTVLGEDWGNAEIAKPLEERHTILKWYNSLCKLQKETVKNKPGQFYSVKETGLLSAYYGLAYNLYLLQHNVELQKHLVQRLKQQEGFHAAYYETYVAAWFILAGFTLRLENERDHTSTHPEFVASKGELSFSVEAKAREPGKTHFEVGNQLYKALRKEAHHPRVVFIDMNVGPDVDLQSFSEQASRCIKGREISLTIDNAPAPPAFVFVTNQPYHLALERTNFPRLCLAVGFKFDDFGYLARFKTYTEAYKSHKKHELLYDVQKALASYRLPSTFDGEVPQFAFGQAKRRFTIGSKIQLDNEFTGVLQAGTVDIKNGIAIVAIQIDGHGTYIANIKLSDNEIAAYKSHPETFFGQVQQVHKEISHPLELFSFFVDTYKNTPRARLVEIMAGKVSLDFLESLSDEDLLYYYAEGFTHTVTRNQGVLSPSGIALMPEGRTGFHPLQVSWAMPGETP